MKKTNLILLTSGIIIMVALKLEVITSRIPVSKKTAKLYSLKANDLKVASQFVKNNSIFPVIKKSIDLDTGIQMKYIEVGNPNGRTLLFIHGYTDSSRSFEKLMKALLVSDPDLRLIAPDLRGHGESSLPAFKNTNSFKMEFFARDILNFIKLKKLSKVDLVSHSMGTVIAQEIALEHPEKVTSLTMIGALVNGEKNSAIQDFLMPELLGEWKKNLIKKFGSNWKKKSYNMTPKDLGTEVTTFLKENWVTDADTDASLMDNIYLETINIPLATWFGALEALSEVDNFGRMRNLKTPTLIIWGEGDELTIQADQNQLLDACQAAKEENGTPYYFNSYGSTGTEKAKPGHNLHWGLAKKVANDIEQFINLEQN